MFVVAVDFLPTRIQKKKRNLRQPGRPITPGLAFSVLDPKGFKGKGESGFTRRPGSIRCGTTNHTERRGKKCVARAFQYFVDGGRQPSTAMGGATVGGTNAPPATGAGGRPPTRIFRRDCGMYIDSHS